MRWYCLQHVPFEGPANLVSWVARKGHSLNRVEVWKNAPFPDLDVLDGLFILGGPMNVYEEDRHPWLAPEKRFIESAVRAGKPILGICLGAQLLSLVLGGAVTKNVLPEIGWFPVYLTASGRETELFRDFPEEFMAFHWHGDRFSIPPGAVHSARSDACGEQAFVYGRRIVGLQFHLESTKESIGALVKHCGEEITCGPTIQDPPAMEELSSYLPETHAILDRLLSRLASEEPRATNNS
jgi:GMP synthase-like glutamine amidotransferase